LAQSFQLPCEERDVREPVTTARGNSRRELEKLVLIDFEDSQRSLSAGIFLIEGLLKSEDAGIELSRLLEIGDPEADMRDASYRQDVRGMERAREK
jgi:hypothetical protein